MTFVYNQLVGISETFKPLVFCEQTQNLDRFPASEIFQQKKDLGGRVLSFLNRVITQKFTTLSPRQISYWLNIGKKFNIKLLHAHFGPAGIEMMPIAKQLKIPLIVTLHGYDAAAFLEIKSYVHSLRELANNSEFIICVSDNMKERLIAIGLPEHKLITHYIGIPIEKFQFIDRTPIPEKVAKDENITFLQVANFVEKKGHEFTVRAFASLTNQYPKASLTLAGDGPLRPSIESLVNTLGLTQKVAFKGAVDTNQVSQLMGKADCFLHHSITASNGDMEGIPTVLMEAMATGLPVVSTYHSGIPELIKHGENGYLVEERNINQYTNQLKSLLIEKAEINLSARITIEQKFNISMQNKHLINIYKKALQHAK